MYTETKNDVPKSIYVNPQTMQIVGEGYPNAIKYVREEDKTKIHMDEMSFIGHAI